MKAILSAVLVFVFTFVLQAQDASLRDEWFRNLDLENAVAQSDLIVVVHVEEAKEMQVIRGGKVESALYQYTFKPKRVLKGVFAREQLIMGSGELGLHSMKEMRALKKGMHLLVFLGRSSEGYLNSNMISDHGANRISQSLPPLTGLDDPLLAAVQTLLSANAEHNRVKRVELLLAGLENAKGPGSVVLLNAIRRRALIAAQSEKASAVLPNKATVLTKQWESYSPAVLEAAGNTIHQILLADYRDHIALRESVVVSGVDALRRSDPAVVRSQTIAGVPFIDPNAAARSAIIRALGAAGEATIKSEDAMARLTPLEEPKGWINNVERAAQFRALGDLKSKPAGMKELFMQVPLDDSGEYISAAAYAFMKTAPEEAVPFLVKRIHDKILAGFDVRAEIRAFRDAPHTLAIPVLIDVFNDAEKEVLTQTCLTVIKQHPDSSLVGPLSKLLGPDEPARATAVEALLEINSLEAAKALRPHLAGEPDLNRKLKIAALLGRHGFKDGYVYAIEHVSELFVQEEAVNALAAIKEPKAVARLKEILKTSNDLRWNTAAVRALGAMQVKEMAPEFLELASSLRNPLAPAALIALGDLGEPQALPKILEGLDSRNEQIVIASARAAGKLLALNDIKEIAIETKLVSILCDADAYEYARKTALDALIAIQSSGLDPALPIVIRESDLENTDLLNRIEQEMKKRKVGLWDGFGMIRR